MSEILIFLLSFANLYPPFGPREATRILFFTSVCSVCSRYLFGIPCLSAIDSFLTGSVPELIAISRTASIAYTILFGILNKIKPQTPVDPKPPEPLEVLFSLSVSTI